MAQEAERVNQEVERNLSQNNSKKSKLLARLAEGADRKVWERKNSIEIESNLIA